MSLLTLTVFHPKPERNVTLRSKDANLFPFDRESNRLDSIANLLSHSFAKIERQPNGHLQTKLDEAAFNGP